MKLWLASFPRSGNTFARNIFYHCYGIESSSWHKELSYSVRTDYQDFEIVKTHLLPSDLIPEDTSIPSVYIVRDGRDAVVSMAHHRKDIVEPGTEFEQNLKEAIIAADGSFFGGWSGNVNAWMERADIVIRYEELIADPQTQIERIRKIYALPEPDFTKLPGFDTLRSGQARYGSGKSQRQQQVPGTFSEKFFRKGKSGGWKDEMEEKWHNLFWNYHGETMERLGYHYDGSIGKPDPVYDRKWNKKIYPVFKEKSTSVQRNPKKVLIEATKITGSGNDGVKRYVLELLDAIDQMQASLQNEFEFDIFILDMIYPLKRFREYIDLDLHPHQLKDHYTYEQILLTIRKGIKTIIPENIYEKLAPIYRNSKARERLFRLRKKVTINKFKGKGQIVADNTDDADKNPLKKYDIIHVTLPQNFGQFTKADYPLIFTVHDLSHKTYPQFHEYANIQLSEEGMQFIVERSAKVIAISESTANDTLNYYSIGKENIKIIPEAANSQLFQINVNPDLKAKVLTQYGISDSPYLLSLSTLEPRKNLINTIKAFRELRTRAEFENIQLVIAGKKGWKYEEIFEFTGTHPDGIIFTGFVADDDLKVLYSHATAFCYVSWYEGFGLPLLESMRCGTPVIFGKNSSQVEIASEAGIGVNPQNINEILQAMETLLINTELRSYYSNQALKNAYTYSWRKTAIQTIEFYRTVIQAQKVE